MPCNNDDYRYLFLGNLACMRVAYACWQSLLVLHMHDRLNELVSCKGSAWRMIQVLMESGIERRRDDVLWLVKLKINVSSF